MHALITQVLRTSVFETCVFVTSSCKNIYKKYSVKRKSLRSALEDRHSTNQTWVIVFFVKEKPYVNESRGRNPNRVGTSLWAADDWLAETFDD